MSCEEDRIKDIVDSSISNSKKESKPDNHGFDSFYVQSIIPDLSASSSCPGQIHVWTKTVTSRNQSDFFDPLSNPDSSDHLKKTGLKKFQEHHRYVWYFLLSAKTAGDSF